MRSTWRKEGSGREGKRSTGMVICHGKCHRIGMAAMLVTVLCFLGGSVFSQTNIEKALSERRQSLLEYLVEEESAPSFAAVAARYATNERIAEANAMFSQLLRQPSNEASYCFNLTATFLLGQRSMPDSLRKKVQRIFSTHAFLRGEGEHNHLMYYVSILLAAQNWPEMTAEQWFNGKSSAENWREARAYIANWMEKTMTHGQVQFDSPALLPSFVASLELLHEFVVDDHPLASANGNAHHLADGKNAVANLRVRAGMMLDLLLIDFALEHIDGLYAGGHSHDTEPEVYSPRQSASAALSWLYFGTGEMKPTLEALFSALSGYSVPQLVFDLATNRDPIGGYVHRERKRVGSLQRKNREASATVYKYAYITRDYILGSVQGGLLYPMQQHSWDLTCRAPKDRHPTLFVMHPYYDKHELGTFYAEESSLLLEELTKFKSRYAQSDKLVGGSPYERIFQHRNVLIALYNIPEGVRFGYLNGFFSEDLQDFILARSDGSQHPAEWIFCRTGNTYIALRPLQPFRFERMDGGLRFISEGRRNGLILEVSTPEESQNFEEFKRRVREVGKLEMRESGNQIRVKYITTYGDRMEFNYDSGLGTVERYLNEYPIAIAEWPLFENPFIKFDESKRLLKLRVKNKWRVLDFLNWTVSEREVSITDELGW
jgi:hypothetical protein